MDFVQNIPFFSIILSMFSGIVSSVLSGKNAKRLNTFVVFFVGVMSFVLFLYLMQKGESYIYRMGHFPAPWGNEIRAGGLEAFMAFFFCVIMLCSLIGGRKHLIKEIEENKVNLYYILVNLLLSSLLALIYTNDLFTAYVFVEINTISACGLIMIRQTGRTIEAATRYMIMSLLGSGLLLIGICLLYDLTGHLLMSYIQMEIAIIVEQGMYTVPIILAIAFISIGLAIKSALYPFHSWLPDAYGYSTVSSSAILSSLVSKGYIFLLIKIFYRIIGFAIIRDSKIIHILFAFGICGMIMGSLGAIKENDIRRMIAFSSVAQIGYIYIGIGLGTKLAMTAGIFHIFSHAASKALLFISAVGITDASNESKKFADLTGAGYRNMIAGVGFTIGSLSMVGVPLFSGFISKFMFAQSSLQVPGKMLPALIVLGISTILNTIYFMKTVIRIYTPAKESTYEKIRFFTNLSYSVSIICFGIVNVTLGLWSQPIVEMIQTGLDMLA